MPVAKPVIKPAAKIGKKAKTNGKKKLNTGPKNCVGGFSGCKSCTGDYMDVDGERSCDSCDKYLDQNPWDPYWEHMHTDFGESKEYKELEKAGTCFFLPLHAFLKRVPYKPILLGGTHPLPRPAQHGNVEVFRVLLSANTDWL